MATDFKQLLEKCEEYLRAGHVGKTAQLVAHLNLSRVPREWRLPLAKVCRRAGHTSLGLKLLTATVLSPQKKLSTVPTPQEVSEYAVLLQRNGSVDEALRILDKVDSKSVPEAELYRAFCYFNRWDYLSAIPRLEKYLAATPAGYAQLTGQVNLCAAFAMTRNHEQALALLAPAMVAAHAGGHRRLEANLLEISAQVRIQMDEPQKAENNLDRALALLDSLKVHDSVFIQKWKAVLQATRENSAAPLIALRERARSGRFFETVRETDLYSLKINFDQRVFENVLFGTPYVDYRTRVQRETGVRHLGAYTMYDGGGATSGTEGAPVMNLESGELDGREIIKAGGKIHQTLSVLLRDFYKPAKVGTLFTELFPGEYFDIFSSPDRIHQILKRARAWVAESGLPLDIVQDQSAYHLEINGPVVFKIALDRAPTDWFGIQARRAAAILSRDRSISGGDLKKALGMTEAEYKRYLKWALEEGKITRVGGGRTTSYKAA